MLTPEFSLSQDDAMVHLKIRAPYIRAQEVEIDVQGPDFKFYAPPYFLRLSLPASLIEDGREKASFDVGSGWLSLSLPKETTGEEFPDLDLLSRLLASKNESLPSPPVGPQGQLIQDLSLGSVSNDDEGKGDDQEDTKIEFNWDYPQTPVVPSATTETGDILFGQSSKNMYGFNNEYSGAESHLHAMAHEVLEIQSLDASTPASRRLERLAKETRSFDPEHYQGDFLGERDGELSEVLAFRPVTWAALKRIQKTRADNTTGNDLIDPATMTKKEDGSEESCLVLTPEEQTELAQLKYKECKCFLQRSSVLYSRLMSQKKDLIQNEASIYLGLVDLIFSYCYNHRTTEGEGTVESPWTLCKVSATLSCFEVGLLLL